jgi:acetylornithine/succinyldiaminopimelate/putrescine aminotransferase
VLIDEKLSENSAEMGNILLSGLKSLPKEIVQSSRGKGLFCAITINPSKWMK